LQWVDEHTRSNGQIERDEWIAQAKLLAAGKDNEFASLYGSAGAGSASASKAKTAQKQDKPVIKPALASGIAKAPKKLKSAKGGTPDELQRISGIGPKLEKTLHELGFFHFEQIASWTPDEVQWVDDNLQFKGRIDREKWIPQAKAMMSGDDNKSS